MEDKVLNVAFWVVLIAFIVFMLMLGYQYDNMSLCITLMLVGVVMSLVLWYC